MEWEQKYQRLGELGEGASGKIYKVQVKGSSKVMAAKVIRLKGEADELGAIQQEIQIMGNCHHPNIVGCYGVEVFKEEVWILMEYCEGGSLADDMKSKRQTLEEEEIKPVVRQVLEGLSYLHKQGIVHRDIKASNLLIIGGSVKIADFGVSFYEHNSREDKHCKIGSPFWMSPESIKDSLYTAKLDIWALGVTILEMAEGVPPYAHQHPFRAIYSIQSHPPSGFKQPQKWSQALKDLVHQCLTVNHLIRPTAQQLLGHQFLTGVVKSNPPTYPSLQSSPSNPNESTLILHQGIPKSFWERQSCGPSQAKSSNPMLSSVTDTVIVKEGPEEESFYFDVRQIPSLLPLQQSSPNHIQKQANRMSRPQRQIKARELMLEMEKQVKQVRNKYMTRLKALYNPERVKENSRWQNDPTPRESLFRKQGHAGCSSLALDSPN